MPQSEPLAENKIAPPESIPAGDRLFEGACCALCGATEWRPGDNVLGSLGHGRQNICALFCKACKERHDADHFAAIDGEISRRKLLRAEPKGAEPVRCYERQPEVLPETLPAGTRWKDRPEFSGRSGIALETVRLDRHGVYCGSFSGGVTGRGIHAEYIDWTTVPIARAEPVAAAEPPAQPAKVDPYAAFRDHGMVGQNTDAICSGVKGERIAALMKSGDALDRLAAHRSKVGQLLGELSKPLPSKPRHASDWDVADAPECCSTHGSSGR